MIEHKNAPFSHLHKAKFDGGLAADKPVASEGLGDAYYETDTGALNIGLADFSWANFNPSVAVLYQGVRNYLGAASTVAGTNTPGYIHWDSQNWGFGSFGAVGDLILIPVSGVYRYAASLKLQNTQPALWTFNVWSSDFDVLTTHTVQADGSGDALELNIAGELIPQVIQPTTGGWVYIDAAQDSGSDQDILIGSFITLSKISDDV